MSISCSQNNVSGCSPEEFIDLIDTKIKEFNKMLDGEGLTTATYAQGPLNDRIIKFQELFGGNQTSFDSETCFSLLSFIYIFLHGDVMPIISQHAYRSSQKCWNVWMTWAKINSRLHESMT